MKTKDDRPIVYLVDDDEAVRDSLGMLFKSIGLLHESYASALDFLQRYDAKRHSCLVADIRMPGLSGLELQQRLNDQRAEIPVIFITGHGDVPMAVTAMKSGAADFIQKPFRDQDLIDRINKALARDGERRKGRAEEDDIRRRIALLTPREREVMERVVRGQANKVIAMDLGVSQRTVELHRARVMRKVRLRSVAELVHAIDRIGGVESIEPTVVAGTAASQ
jgi:two-component system response regulator FixJ